MESKRILLSFVTTVKRRFPELLTSFSQLPDPRKAQGKQYSMQEVLFGGLSLFLLKEGSRNQFNNHRKDGYFSEQYHHLSGMKLPHGDTVKDVLVDLPNEKLEQVKMDLMSQMFEQQWLRQYRLLNKYYTVAIDATGVMSFKERHCKHCLTKTSKTGEVTYFHYVLEAKLVTRDGHALSMASEWIENSAEEFDKQDCEQKAFVRLAQKLKKQYPRLPVCLLADGLYPNETVFDICEANQWKFIFVLQDKSLKTVQKELTLTREREPVSEWYTAKKGWHITQKYRYQNDIEYHKKYHLNWVQGVETRKKMKQRETNTPPPQPEHSTFEYVTNLRADRENVREIACGGRLRWKIENEGFNTQKHGDYELEHKFCRNSYNGLKNCYTLLQIAHAMNQLVEKGKIVTAILKLRPKETIHNLWQKLKHYMIFCKPSIVKYPVENEEIITQDTS